MRGLKRFLAVVLALLFIVLLPIGLLALAAQGLLLTPDFYKQQLVKSGFYSRVYTELVPALTEKLDPPKELPLTKDEMGELVRRLVPESFVQTQMEKAIDEVFAVLTSQKDTLRIIVPLREIKQRIPDEVVSVLERKLETLPMCSETAPLPPGPPEGFPTCVPSGVDVDGFKSQYRAQATAELRKMSDSLPDSLDLTKQLSEESGGVERLRSSLEGARKLLSDFALGALFFYALLFVMLILVGILGGNSFNSGVGWVGITLLVGGVVALLATLVIPVVSGEMVARFGQDPKTPKEVVSIIAPVLTSIIADLMRRTQIEAGAVTVGGGVLFLVSRLI